MMKKEGVKKVTKEAIKTLVEFLEYKINEIVVEALNISNKTKKPLDIDFRCPRLTGRSIRDAINNINDIECIEVDDINDIDNIDNIEYIEDIENWEIKE
ncbi:MAG: histone-like protein [Acidithiobacillus sp.]